VNFSIVVLLRSNNGGWDADAVDRVVHREELEADNYAAALAETKKRGFCEIDSPEDVLELSKIGSNMSNQKIIQSLSNDLQRILQVRSGAFVRGVVVLETEEGNFLTIYNGHGSEELEAAGEAAMVAMGKEPESDEG